MIDVLSTFDKKPTATRRQTMNPSPTNYDSNQFLGNERSPHNTSVRGSRNEFTRISSREDYLHSQQTVQQPIHKRDENDLMFADILKSKRSTTPIPQNTFGDSTTSFNLQSNKNNNIFENEFDVSFRETKTGNQQISKTGIQEIPGNRASTRRRESVYKNGNPTDDLNLNRQNPVGIISPRDNNRDSKLTDVHKGNNFISISGDLNNMTRNVIPSSKVSMLNTGVNIPIETKSELLTFKQIIEQKESDLNAKNHEIKTLKELNTKHEKSYHDLTGLLRIQMDNEVKSREEMHKKEVEFLQNSHEQIITHYKDQLIHLQKMLAEKGTEIADIKNGFKNIEQKIILNTLPRTEESQILNNARFMESQNNLESKISELNKIIQNMRQQENLKETKLRNWEEILDHKNEQIQKRETKIEEKERNLNEKIGHEKRNLENQFENLKFEFSRNAHLEKEVQMKTESLENEETQLRELRNVLLAEQNSRMQEMSRKNEDIDRLKMDWLRKDTEVNQKLKIAEDFFQNHETKFSQFKIEEQNLRFEVRNLQVQKSLLTEKENQVILMQKNVDFEREKITEINQGIKLGTIRNQMMQTANMWNRNDSQEVVGGSRMKSLLHESNIRLFKLTQNKNLTAKIGFLGFEKNETKFEFQKTKKDWKNESVDRKFEGGFDLQEFIKRMNQQV